MLASGVRVLTEHAENTYTVSVGFRVGTGSADENEGMLGSTHFLEHLLSKGTASCSAKQLADRTDFLGSNSNTGMDKQLAYYYGHAMEEDLVDAVGPLMGMAASSTLAETSMKMERDIILEELMMYTGDASEVAHERIASLAMDGHPLGRPIGGTSKSALGLDHVNLTSHYRQNYRPEGLVVAAAGKTNRKALCAMVEASLRHAGQDLHEGAASAERRRRASIEYPENWDLSIECPVEQSTVVAGMPAMTDEDKRRYALYTLLTILGGGISSRFPQKAREKRSLAYSTYSFPGLYHEGGPFGLYAGCSPGSTEDVAKVMERCLEAIAGESVTKMKLETSYRRARADRAFSSGSVSSWMNQLGQAEIVHGFLISQQEVLHRPRGVSADGVAVVAAELVRAQRSRATVSPSQ